MKRFRDKIVCNLLYGGITKQEYREIRDEILEKDRSSLSMTSLCLLMMFCGLFVGSLSSEMMAPNRIAYGAIGGCFVVIHLLCRMIRERGKMWIIPLWYLAMTMMFIYSIMLNTVIRNDISATTFCLIILGAPLLFTDMPWRIFSYLLLVICAFIPIAFHQKPYYLAFSDSVNAACCIFLAVVIHINIIRTKMREIMQRRYIERQRDTDKLTGCLTKSAFEYLVKKKIASRDYGGVLIVLDIDNFKKINDSYGHVFGDMVLHTMGESIRQSFPENAIYGRFGGDEFQVWLSGVYNRKEIVAYLNGLVDHIHAIQTPDHQIQVSASLGVAVCPDNGNEYSILFEGADTALYSAKQLGKNRYVFCVEMRNNNKRGSIA